MVREHWNSKELNRRAEMAFEEGRNIDRSTYGIVNPELRLLLEMAVKGIVPNGKFSDNECNAWSLMRSVLRDCGVQVVEI